MPRPRSQDPRSEHVDIRVTKGEKARIADRAIAAGMPIADFVRARALGLKPRGLRPEPTPARPPARPVNPQVLAEGVERQAVADEIEEAKLVDGEAREAFIARRTLQLVGHGNTRPVAARMARLEWESRAT